MAIFNSFLYVYQRVSVENGSFIDDLPMKMKKNHKSAANSWQMAHFFGFSMFFILQNIGHSKIACQKIDA